MPYKRRRDKEERESGAVRAQARESSTKAGEHEVPRVPGWSQQVRRRASLHDIVHVCAPPPTGAGARTGTGTGGAGDCMHGAVLFKPQSKMKCFFLNTNLRDVVFPRANR